MLDRRMLANFDWMLFSLVLIIACIGLSTVYSATWMPGMPGTPAHGMPATFLKQLQWIIGGIIVMAVVIIVDYHTWSRFTNLFYGLALAMLILVLVAGKSAMGAARWISLGPISFQPSELAKLALIFVIAKYLTDNPHPEGLTLRALLPPAGLLLVPLILVAKQPDLGTALLFMFVATALIFVAGINRRTLVGIVSSATVISPFALYLFWTNLKEYQKNRLMVFFNPDTDPTGIGYHVTQSKIAIGSGMLTGKGFLAGTQSHLKFLPERHTDFIFSVFAEEWGLVGSLLLLALYFLLIMRGIEIAHSTKDRLGKFLATGAVTMLFFYVFINLGMTLGIMPVVGVPLPLMSYGGTAMLTTFIAIGILLNVRMRRFMMVGSR